LPAQQIERPVSWRLASLLGGGDTLERLVSALHLNSGASIHAAVAAQLKADCTPSTDYWPSASISSGGRSRHQPVARNTASTDAINAPMARAIRKEDRKR
jgi:hypothetical protein